MRSFAFIVGNRGLTLTKDAGRGLRCALQHERFEALDRNGVAILLPLVGVSSQDFGPLHWGGLFYLGQRSQHGTIAAAIAFAQEQAALAINRDAPSALDNTESQEKRAQGNRIEAEL